MQNLDQHSSQISPVRVSVVIVNWNTRDLLDNCLRSIIDQTRSTFEVIVIDNASTDGSVAMVRSKYPQMEIVENTVNRGFAAANNQGLATAVGQNVLLLNPDTLVIDGAIDTMLDWLEQNPDVGCVGCQVLEAPGVIQQTCFADPTPLNQFIVEFGLMRFSKVVPFLGRPWYRTWDRRSQRDVDVVSGMFMLVPRRVLDQVGPLDDAFFVYAEEADWCRRIRKAGFRCVFAPIAQIMHLDGGSKSTSQIRTRMYVQIQKSHLIYARKHHGMLGYAAVKVMLIISALLRLSLSGLLALIRRSPDSLARIRLSRASLRYHLLGQGPAS
jgi:GT2 family glycosyltransferase